MAAKLTSEGKELQLLKKVDGSLELDQNVLYSVLTHPSIGDRPISVVSIAGAFRTGKSFMLNFFLRYLGNKGYENPDSMSNLTTSVKGGIQWKGGPTGNTCGINIWSEPFIVKQGSKEIAVILLDTQGNSDHSASRESEVKVFVISTLLSSTFIYNLSKIIKNSDLEYLQFFTEHAKATKNTKGNKSSFQVLWFLVRDWDYSNEFRYGKGGGKLYLQKKVFDTNDENSLKKYLQEAFGSVNCFLMPNPGKTVRMALDESSITFKDIDDEFCEQIPKLTGCILNPECLVAKCIEGDLVNGRWLAEYASRCWDEMKNGGLPSSDTMMELTAKSKCREYIDKGREKCKAKIEELHTTYANDSRLRQIELEAKRDALKIYDENVKYGGPKIIQEYRSMLENAINQQIDTFHGKNALFKTETEKELEEAVTSCQEKYKEKILELTGQIWTEPEQLIRLFQKNDKEITDSFRLLSKLMCRELVKPYSDRLVQKLKELRLYFIKENERYEEDAKHSFETLLSNAIGAHRSCLEKVISGTSISDADFSATHEKGKETALIQFLNAFPGIAGPNELKEKYSEKVLLRGIDETKQLFQDKNESLRKAEDDKIFKTSKKTLLDFMNETFNGKIVDDSTIEKECRKKSENLLLTLKANKSFFPKWRKEVKRIIQEYKSENEILRKKADLRLHQEKKKITQKFVSECNQKLREGGQYIENEDLDEFINSEIKTLTETSLAQEKIATEEMISEFHKDVKERLQKKANEIRVKNGQNMQNYEYTLRANSNYVMSECRDMLEQHMGHGYIEPSILQEQYEKCKEIAVNIFAGNGTTQLSNIEERHKDKVLGYLDCLYQKCLKWNESNKQLQRRTGFNFFEEMFRQLLNQSNQGVQLALAASQASIEKENSDQLRRLTLELEEEKKKREEKSNCAIL